MDTKNRTTKTSWVVAEIMLGCDQCTDRARWLEADNSLTCDRHHDERGFDRTAAIERFETMA